MNRLRGYRDPVTWSRPRTVLTARHVRWGALPARLPTLPVGQPWLDLVDGLSRAPVARVRPLRAGGGGEFSMPCGAATAAMPRCCWSSRWCPARSPDPRSADPAFRMVFARLVRHYWSHGCFLEEDQISGQMDGLLASPPCSSTAGTTSPPHWTPPGISTVPGPTAAPPSDQPHGHRLTATFTDQLSGVGGRREPLITWHSDTNRPGQPHGMRDTP